MYCPLSPHFFSSFLFFKCQPGRLLSFQDVRRGIHMCGRARCFLAAKRSNKKHVLSDLNSETDCRKEVVVKDVWQKKKEPFGGNLHLRRHASTYALRPALLPIRKKSPVTKRTSESQKRIVEDNSTNKSVSG